MSASRARTAGAAQPQGKDSWCCTTSTHATGGCLSNVWQLQRACGVCVVFVRTVQLDSKAIRQDEAELAAYGP
eukprot:363348-Chlamydomonas_euryale.AAC.9